MADLRSLSPEAMAQAAEQMLAQLLAQGQQIAQQAHEIKFKDAKLEKVMFELARLKAWKFGAKTEAMSAEQRRLFEETLAEDEANLQAQLERLQARHKARDEDADKRRRSPKCQALPAHLRRVEHPHEPADTNCPSADCGRPMVRVGEDVSERLDIVPAEFFVHRHIYGKWACRCCQRFVLQARVLHADETPVAMLDPGRGKTKRAYVWAYARGAFDPAPGVVYEFCLGRGAQYPMAFLQGSDGPDPSPPWQGTLVRDEYTAYDSVVAAHPARVAAGCLAHARRHFHELGKANASEVATEALRRIAAIYRAERELAELDGQERLHMRQAVTRPLWEELHVWLRLERGRVPDGGATAKALNYSLNAWETLTRNLLDGDVPVDNNHLENRIRPWTMGRRAWLFAGSELAGQRAAVVMSLVQSARLCGHDPHAYLNDVLQRLPTHRASRIDDLLPHRWQPLI